MQIITKKIHETEYAYILELPSFYEDCCYIDIETTGFDRNRHMIYLVGLIFQTKGTFYLQQYLCDKESDEYELLYRINQQLSQYKYLVHFNGQSFDLPFIKSRLALYQIKEEISGCQSIDYYQALKSYKGFLRIENLKLKTVEQLLGYKRLDPFSGGELIELYHMYVQGNEKLKPILLLHNEEDMMGLYYLNAFYPLFTLFYEKTMTINYHKETAPNHLDSLVLSASIPQSKHYYTFTHQTPYGHVEILHDRLICSLPVYTGILKHFYSNYKDYYYLPVEDYAIHKSVAGYVHHDYKKKATKTTAYVKKKDTYIRCPLSEKEIKRLQTPHKSIKLFHADTDETFTYIQIDDFKTIAYTLFSAITKAILF